jgi:hypothetical protein
VWLLLLLLLLLLQLLQLLLLLLQGRALHQGWLAGQLEQGRLLLLLLLQPLLLALAQARQQLWRWRHPQQALPQLLLKAVTNLRVSCTGAAAAHSRQATSAQQHAAHMAANTAAPSCNHTHTRA